MNYIKRQVESSQEAFASCWPTIRTYDTPLQGSVLVPVTERGDSRNSRAAWLMDTDAKIDVLAQVSGVGLYGIAARVFRLKDTFQPYNTITFRFNQESQSGELQSLIKRAKAGCLFPSFIVSVQMSEAKGIRHVGVVDTRKLIRAVMNRSDRSTIRVGSSGVSFYSIDLSSLPDGTAWSFCREGTMSEGYNQPVLDAMCEMAKVAA